MNGQTILGGWPIPTTWIAETLIATTLLMIAVLLLRGPVTRYCGARVAYLLWLAPGLRMLLPPLPQSWFPAAAMPSTLPVPDAAVTFADTAIPVTLAAAAGGGVAWSALSLSVWLGGAALFFAWHWLSYRRFAHAALDNADWLDHDGPVPVATSAAISSPIALGIFGRRVLVPADFTHRFDADEQRLALDHELAHHRRLDLPVNLAALAMLSLHWFNPIAHIAHRAFRLDQEAACDAIVLSRAGASKRLAYGTALYKSATGAMPLAVCALGDASQLKSRLRLIVSGEASRAWMQCGGALTAVIVMMGLVITASSQVAAVAAAPDTPRMVVIGGGEIDPDAYRAARRAEAKAEVAAAKAQRAMKVAEQAQRRSDRARQVAMTRAERAGAVILPPVPPLTPVPPMPSVPSASPAPFAPPAPIAPLRPTAEHAVKCPEGGKDVIASRVTSADGHSHHMSVVICRKAIAAQARASAASGLAAARTEIARDASIPAMQKAQILSGIDNQIKRLTVRYFTLQ